MSWTELWQIILSNIKKILYEMVGFEQVRLDFATAWIRRCIENVPCLLRVYNASGMIQGRRLIIG